MFDESCCTFDRQHVEEVRNSTATRLKYTESYIQVGGARDRDSDIDWIFQGYKYLSLLPQCYVRHLLKGSPEVKRAADYEIFPNMTMRQYR